MSVTFFLSVLACRQCPERQCPERQCSEQQCAPAFSGMVSPWSVHGVSPGRSWSVPGRSWSVPGHSRVAHGRFMMSVPDVSPQFQSWVRHLRHAGMALKYLWARSPCRRPVRRPLSHAITCIRWVSPDSHVRGNTRLSESSAVRCHRSS